jgi:hypothetical protein
MSDSTTQSVLFPGIFAKPVVVKLDHEHSSSDGGALLLKAVDERLELSQRLAACVDDPRQPGKVRHAMLDLLRQRIYAIACGYPDGNDAARLAQDPIHKLMLERDPIAGERLASQPTLSRFENTPRRADVYRLTDALADVVIGGRGCTRGSSSRGLACGAPVPYPLPPTAASSPGDPGIPVLTTTVTGRSSSALSSVGISRPRIDR